MASTTRGGIVAQVYLRDVQYGEGVAQQPRWDIPFLIMRCRADTTAEALALTALSRAHGTPLIPLADVLLCDTQGVPLPSSATDGEPAFCPVAAASTAADWRRTFEAYQGAEGRRYKLPAKPDSPLVTVVVVPRPAFDVTPQGAQAGLRSLHDAAYAATGRAGHDAAKASRRQHAALQVQRSGNVAAIEIQQHADERLAILRSYGVK
jgi:hypothetical protein